VIVTNTRVEGRSQ